MSTEEFSAYREGYADPFTNVSAIGFRTQQSYPFYGFHLAIGGNWNMGRKGYGNAALLINYFQFTPQQAVYFPNIEQYPHNPVQLGSARNFFGIGLRLGFGLKL
jgi:hypothetical protein